MGLFNRKSFPLLSLEEAQKAAEKAAVKRDSSRVDQVGLSESGVPISVYGAYTPSGYPRLVKLEHRQPTRAMLEGDRYTLKSDPERAVFDPEQRIVVVLNGETARTAEAFLQYVLKDIKKHGLGLLVDAADYLRAAARLHFPTRYLQPGLYDLELRHAQPAARDEQSIRETLKASRGVTPVELVYPTKRGAPTVRHVLVRGLHQDYFTAEHKRGVRSYRYDKTISALRLIGLADTPLVETPTLVIEYSSTEIRATFMGLTEHVNKLNSGYYENYASREFEERLAKVAEQNREFVAKNALYRVELDRLEKRLD